MTGLAALVLLENEIILKVAEKTIQLPGHQTSSRKETVSQTLRPTSLLLLQELDEVGVHQLFLLNEVGIDHCHHPAPHSFLIQFLHLESRIRSHQQHAWLHVQFGLLNGRQVTAAPRRSTVSRLLSGS